MDGVAMSPSLWVCVQPGWQPRVAVLEWGRLNRLGTGGLGAGPLRQKAVVGSARVARGLSRAVLGAGGTGAGRLWPVLSVC